LRTGERDLAAVARRLEAAGVPFSSVTVVPPSLEDVFLDVVERSR
jgi:hypothetical protein